MLKLIILIGIIYGFYRIRKYWQKLSASINEQVSGNTAGQIDDIMVKDPHCEVYFPKRNGIRTKIDGKEVYFCSTECRDNYMTSHST